MLLRSVGGFLLRNSEFKTTNTTFGLEFVRWRRKPRWLPTAKTKLYRVPERKPQPMDEKLELLRLHNNYKTQMRSLRLFLREDAQRVLETSTADHFVITAEEEEIEFQKCLAENEEWNRQIAVERDERLKKETEARRQYIQTRLQLAEERELDRLERAEDIVKREKVSAKSFITPETIDSAIEVALANPVDYNFSIDLKGKMYVGRSTLPCSDATKDAIQAIN